MRQEYSLVIAASLVSGKSHQEREQYRRDLHWLINQKFPGYADRTFRSRGEAAILARQIQLHFNVTFDIVPEMNMH